MAKRKIDQDYLKRKAEKIMEWGNLSYVGLVIAQLVPGSGQVFNWAFALLGLFCMGFAYALADRMVKGGEA